MNRTYETRANAYTHTNTHTHSHIHIRARSLAQQFLFVCEWSRYRFTNGKRMTFECHRLDEFVRKEQKTDKYTFYILFHELKSGRWWWRRWRQRRRCRWWCVEGDEKKERQRERKKKTRRIIKIITSCGLCDFQEWKFLNWHTQNDATLMRCHCASLCHI